MSNINNNLGINKFKFEENSYSRNDKTYNVSDLISISKDLPVFELDIRGIDIDVNPWGNPSIKSFAYHMQRVNDASLDHPILLDDGGYICDGWHRLAKAIIKGKETIQAKRLIKMPDAI